MKNRKYNDDQLKSASNIFDFLIIIYDEINQKENDYLRSYDEWLCKDKDLWLINRFRDIISNWITDYESSYQYIDLWLNIALEHDYFICCVITLIGANSYFEEFPYKKSDNNIQIYDNLNTNSNIGKFFFSPQNVLQKTFYKNNNLYNGKNILSYENSGLNIKLTKYYIITNTKLMGYNPVIISYKPSKEFINNFIKIGLFHFANKNWWEPQYSVNNTYVSVNILNEYKNEINELYKKTLKLADLHQIDIIIFPELSLTEESINFIRNTNFEHIKIIFAGSMWKDKTNIGYIFTGNGVELAKIEKRTPYEHYDKTRKTSIREDIESPANNHLYFLDINNIGRINYCICKDFLDENFKHLSYPCMRSNFFIVSSYSDKINSFIENAQELCSKNASFICLCNSCYPWKQVTTNKDSSLKFEHSFLTFPTINNKNDGEKRILHNTKFSSGKKDICKSCNNFCSGLSIFEIDVDEFNKNTQNVHYINNKFLSID